MHPDRNLKLSDILHLVPFVIAVTIFGSFIFQSGDAKLQALSEPGISNNVIYILSFMPFVTIVIYFILSIRLIKKHSINYKSFLSNTNIDNIEWIKSLILVFTIYFLFDIISALLIEITNAQIYYLSRITFFSMTVFIHLIIYTLFKYPERIFSTHKISNYKKYQTSKLSEKESNLLQEKLVSYFEKEKPF